jgi:hypothetical protein
MVIEYLTGILAFITAIYAYLTYRMAKASEASVEVRRDGFQPPLTSVRPGKVLQYPAR